MSAPPIVRYPFTPPRRVARALCLLSATGAVVIATWLLRQHASAAQIGFGSLLWVGCGFAAWRWWRDAPSGEIVWDGVQWCLSLDGQDEAPCPAPRICGDLQSCAWVRLGGEGGAARWLWLARDGDPARWLDLRRALFASRAGAERSDTLAAAEAAS